MGAVVFLVVRAAENSAVVEVCTLLVSGADFAALSVVVGVISVELCVCGVDSLGMRMVETWVFAVELEVGILDGRPIVHKFSSEHKLRALSDCISAPFPTKSSMDAGSP